jgi:dihydroneopterin aldolase
MQLKLERLRHANEQTFTQSNFETFSMLTIELTKLRFHAYHGLYHEEKKLGGDFEVNVTVTHQPIKLPILHLDETIDYMAVYNLIKEIMQKPEPLLETVVTLIAEEILKRFSPAEEVNVSISKLNPPILSFEGRVGVKYVLKRSEF